MIRHIAVWLCWLLAVVALIASLFTSVPPMIFMVCLGGFLALVATYETKIVENEKHKEAVQKIITMEWENYGEIRSTSALADMERYGLTPPWAPPNPGVPSRPTRPSPVRAERY